MQTVVEALERARTRTASGFRFVAGGGHETFLEYAEVIRRAACFGAALQAEGLVQGERVGLVIHDNQDFVLAFLGATLAGIVPVPIFPPAGLRRLDSYLEHTLHILTRSAARLLVTDTAAVHSLDNTPPGIRTPLRVLSAEEARKCPGPLRWARVRPEDCCFLQFTSGSTALPRGVVVTHANISANVRAFMECGLRVGEGDSGVSWLPLYHDMGLIGFVLGPLFYQRTTTFLSHLLFLKRPISWLETISRHQATVSFGPSFAYALCVRRLKDRDIERLDLSRWRVAGCGAEPIDVESLLAFAKRLAPAGFDARALMPCYGMAESTLAVSFSPAGTGVATDTIDAHLLASTGRARPIVGQDTPAVTLVDCGTTFDRHEIGIFDPSQRESSVRLPERTVGEIRVRGPSVALGYFGDPELSAETFAGGWLRTGDLGYLGEGHLFVCGRMKDMLIVRGQNYFPQDLEWEAAKVEGVRQGSIIAFGTTSGQDGGEELVVLFESSQTELDGRAQVAAAVRRRIQQATGLVPYEVLAVETGTLPKTSSGKPRRSEARRQYEAGVLCQRPGDGTARDGPIERAPKR